MAPRLSRSSNRNRRLDDFIRKTTISDGDMILIKAGTAIADRNVIHEFSHTLARLGYTRCIIMVVNDFSDIQRMNPKDMAKYGWMRIPVPEVLSPPTPSSEPEQKEVSDGKSSP